MYKTLLIATVAFVAGAAATFALINLDGATRNPNPAASPVLENIPTLSRTAAESHRENRYSSIHTIEDTLALPGDFAQTEALYALAGRSDSAGVQNLIFQANGIADPSDRKAALDILFSKADGTRPSLRTGVEPDR